MDNDAERIKELIEFVFSHEKNDPQTRVKSAYTRPVPKPGFFGTKDPFTKAKISRQSFKLARDVSLAIDKKLLRPPNVYHTPVTLLFLGLPDSGKTDIAKQLNSRHISRAGNKLLPPQTARREA